MDKQHAILKRLKQIRNQRQGLRVTEEDDDIDMGQNDSNEDLSSMQSNQNYFSYGSLRPQIAEFVKPLFDTSSSTTVSDGVGGLDENEKSYDYRDKIHNEKDSNQKDHLQDVFDIENTLFGGKKTTELTFDTITHERDFVELFSFLSLDERIRSHRKTTGELQSFRHTRKGLDTDESIDTALSNIINLFSNTQFTALVDECAEKLKECSIEDDSCEGESNIQTGNEMLTKKLWSVLLKIVSTNEDSESDTNIVDSQKGTENKFSTSEIIGILLQFLSDPASYDFGQDISHLAEPFSIWTLVACYKPLLILSRFNTPDIFFDYMWRLRKEQGFCFIELFNGIFSRGWSPAMLMTNIETSFLTAFEKALYGFAQLSILDIALGNISEKNAVYRTITSWAICRGIAIVKDRKIDSFDLFDVYSAISLLSRSWRNPVFWGFVDPVSFKNLGKTVEESIRNCEKDDEEEEDIWITWDESFFSTLSLLEMYLKLLHARIIELGGALQYGGFQVDLRLVKHKEYYMYCINQITWFLGIISMMEHYFRNAYEMWKYRLRTHADIYNSDSNNKGKDSDDDEDDDSNRPETEQLISAFIRPHMNYVCGSYKFGKSLQRTLADIYEVKANKVLSGNMFTERCLKSIATFQTETVDFCNFSAQFGDMDDALVSLWDKIGDPIDTKLFFLSRVGGSIGTSDKIARRETRTHAQETNKFEMMKFPNGNTNCLEKMLNTNRDWIADATLSLVGIKLCYTGFYPNFSWTDEIFVTDKEVITITKKSYEDVVSYDNESPTRYLSPEFLSLPSWMQEDRLAFVHKESTLDGTETTENCSSSDDKKKQFTKQYFHRSHKIMEKQTEKSDQEFTEKDEEPSLTYGPLFMSPHYKLVDESGTEKEPRILLVGCFYVLISKYAFYVSPILAEIFMVWSAIIDVYSEWLRVYEISYVAADKSIQKRTDICNLMEGTRFTLDIGEVLRQAKEESIADTSESAQRKAKIIESTQKKIDTSKRGTQQLSEADLQGKTTKEAHIQSGVDSELNTNAKQSSSKVIQNRGWGANSSGHL